MLEKPPGSGRYVLLVGGLYDLEQLIGTGASGQLPLPGMLDRLGKVTPPASSPDFDPLSDYLDEPFPEEGR